MRMDAMSWAWMLEGLFALKKFGLASFWSPAKANVTPRKARNGTSAHPERARARGGGASNRTRRRRRPDRRDLWEPGAGFTDFVRCDTSTLLVGETVPGRQGSLRLVLTDSGSACSSAGKAPPQRSGSQSEHAEDQPEHAWRPDHHLPSFQATHNVGNNLFRSDGERRGRPASRHLGVHKTRAYDVHGDTGATKSLGEPEQRNHRGPPSRSRIQNSNDGPGTRLPMTAR